MLPKGTILKIPRTLSQQQARLALAAMPDSLKIEEPPRPRYYRVRRGDNLYAIARRLDISVQELALENNINRINRIYAGQVLRVPGAPAAEKKEPVVQVATAKPTSPPAPSKPKVQPVVAETKPESKPEPKVEPVILSTPKKAEKKIAAAKPRPEPDSVPAEVAALPDTLEELVLARADTATAGKRRSTKVQARFDMDIYELELAPYPRSRTAAITVAVNETIGHYADWLDIPTWHIRRANRMGRRSHIRLGQRLSIPGDAEALEQFKQRRLEYHMGLEEDFYWQYKVTDTRIHTIERGDNLWTLCHQEGEIPLWLLKKHNRQLDLSRLMPGEKVRLPIVEEKTEEDYAMEAAALQDPVSSRMLPREPLLSPLRGVRPAP
jgi:membrane-bound lytic murein transglycosylase D